MCFGPLISTLNPNITSWLQSDSDNQNFIMQSSDIDESHLVQGAGLAAGASFTYNGQSIVAGHVYYWDATNSIFVDVAQVDNHTDDLNLDGNLVFESAGDKVVRPTATSGTAGASSFGTATLVAGTVTINTTNVTANSVIRVGRLSIGATGANPVGYICVGTISAGASFVINSATTATASTVCATDVSTVWWEIVEKAS